MLRKRKGMTLVEVILAIALLGIISVSLITGFSSELMNINRGTDITVEALGAQSIFEDVIYDVKTQIQGHNPADSLDTLVSGMPEWSYETVKVMGQDFQMQKLNKTYSSDVKGNTIYLSRRLAEIEKRNKLPISGVEIEVSTDTNNLMADLALSPPPTLKALHNDNTSEPGFYVNLYRWWKSVPGKDFASLSFPDDFSIINVSQTTDVLTNLLDNVGAGRYVALTVTPVDIHGYRGNTLISSNYVFVKGAEWRIGTYPWADTNNDYNYDGNDVRIETDRIKEQLDANSDTIPNYLNPSEMLSIENSSLFVPMNVDPGGGLEPGEKPMEVTGTSVIDWKIENNINLAKDIQIMNSSDVNITAGTGGSGGSVYLYPYIELDGAGNPVTLNGAPKLINFGTSILTDGNIYLRTLSRGNIELLNHNELGGNNITLEARGSITINNSTLEVNNDIVLDIMKNPEISGERLIKVENTIFSSVSSDSEIYFNTKSNTLFRGGGWSSNQTLHIPNDMSILFTKGTSKINNAGGIDVGNTGRILYEHSMTEDLTRPLRVRLDKKSDDEFLLRTINYNRNVNYAGASNNQTVLLPSLWNKLGSGNHNFEFSTNVVSGPGSVNDLAYSYNGNGSITIDVTKSTETLDTRIRFDVRDRFDNNLVGSGYFIYSVDDDGDSTIEVEEPPPLNYYTITFKTNGGSEIAPVSGYAGENVGIIANPTKIGHNFLGWDKNIPSVIPEADMEINALWEVINYVVTLDTNGGLNMGNLYYQYGEEIYIPNPSRIGYTFDRWDPTPPASMPAENLDFVAQWTNNTLTITFDPNGGTVPNPSSRQVTYDSEYGELPTTQRTGFKFDGWYTDRNNGSLIEEDTIISNPNNHILYAHWVDSYSQLSWLQINPTDQRNSFTLTFNNSIQQIVNTNLGNRTSNYTINGQNVTYNRNNTATGNYYIRVRDNYGQELTVNLRLQRGSFLFWEWFTWSVTGTSQ